MLSVKIVGWRWSWTFIFRPYCILKLNRKNDNSRITQVRVTFTTVDYLREKKMQTWKNKSTHADLRSLGTKTPK